MACPAWDRLVLPGTGARQGGYSGEDRAWREGPLHTGEQKWGPVLPPGGQSPLCSPACLPPGPTLDRREEKGAGHPVWVVAAPWGCAHLRSEEEF